MPNLKGLFCSLSSTDNGDAAFSDQMDRAAGREPVAPDGSRAEPRAAPRTRICPDPPSSLCRNPLALLVLC